MTLRMVSVTGRPSVAMPSYLVDSGFVTPEGDAIFVPAEDMNHIWRRPGGWLRDGKIHYTAAGASGISVQPGPTMSWLDRRRLR